jgi:aryl-alcohol dehydrogenase-like predicted oxidoreductase
MGTVVWGLLGQGLLTGRVRKNQHNDLRRAGMLQHLTDDVLDRIDQIVPPGTDVGTLDQAYQPPAPENPGLRRRPLIAPAAA